MIITLSPQMHSPFPPLVLSKAGDALTINGQVYDFTPLVDGGMLPSKAIGSEYILYDVKRVTGQVELTLLFPIPEGASEHMRYPDILIPGDGPVVLPQLELEVEND
ncbi:MOSC domain-containing protein [Pseudomonas chlororaphis]